MQNMPLTSGNAGYRDGDVILNACKDIDQAIGGLESQLEQLKRLYRAAMENPEGNKRQVDELSSEIMSNYRELVNRLKKVKSQPESQNGRNSGQVGRVDRKLKAAIQSYQNMERDYRKSMQEQAGRQFKIVKPDATPEEIRQATENPDAPIFQQAVSKPSHPHKTLDLIFFHSSCSQTVTAKLHLSLTMYALATKRSCVSSSR